ncbi:hypothetical protein [Cardiobacterium valvarum]|uniref:Lipoprotein n=1 Tax=Cardiobacterium valvarum TaxID=194702 RepID=A0A381DZB3_9GAMM|nr:hypothetical protein [Cardiobacterium valvarum]SUX18807.1 Uncharacterised protein [Cardiobacterium valvarum]
MKKLLIPTLFIMLAACSGEKSSEQNTGHIKHSYMNPSEPAWKMSNDVRIPCSTLQDKEVPCASVLLKEGAPIPKYPLTSSGDILVVYIYDPVLANPAQPGGKRRQPWIIRSNCDLLPSEKDSGLCLTTEDTNKLLEPFLQ